MTQTRLPDAVRKLDSAELLLTFRFAGDAPSPTESTPQASRPDSLPPIELRRSRKQSESQSRESHGLEGQCGGDVSGGVGQNTGGV